MFVFPVMSLAVWSSLGSGTADWPTVGAVLGWMLLAALVGSGLGILRDSTRGARTTAGVGVKDAPAPTADLSVDRSHREAA